MHPDGIDIQLAIREDDLSEFAMHLLGVADDVSDLFSKIDSKMESLKNSFDGAQYQHLMTAYREFRKNYSVVKECIISYSDDLITVINKVRSGDKQIAFNLSKAIDDTIKKAKEII